MERPFIVRDGQRLDAVVHVGLAETVIGVAGFGVRVGVQLQNADGVAEFLCVDELITERVQLIFVEVVEGGLGGLKLTILFRGAIDAGGCDRL